MLARGQVDIVRHDEGDHGGRGLDVTLARLSEGSFFGSHTPARGDTAPFPRSSPPAAAGEAALLTNEPRNASAIVHSDKARFHCIARKSLLDVLGQEGQKRIRSVPALSRGLMRPRPDAARRLPPTRGARQAVIYRSILAGIPMFRVRAAPVLRGRGACEHVSR